MISRLIHQVKTHRLKLIIAMSICIILLIVIRQMNGPDIPCIKPQQEDFIIDVKVNGELEAVRSVSVNVPRDVHFNIRIVDLIRDGSFVKQGDFLVQFDTNEAMKLVSDQEQRLENAKMELNNLKATIATETADLETNYQSELYSYEQAKLRYKQMEFEAKAKQREQEINFKKAELSLEQAKKKIELQNTINHSKIQQAKINIKREESVLQQRKDGVEKLTLRSPINGMVILGEMWGQNGSSKMKIGDSPWPGMAILEIPDLSQMKAKVKINEMNISQIRKGQQVLIRVDALPDRNFYGSVDFIATLAKRKQGTNIKEFDVDIVIDNTDSQLRPGMTAQCQVITDIIRDKVYIPLECVFFEEDTTVVYTKKFTKFVQRKIETGPQNSDYVVVEQGLTKNDKVALYNPTLQINDIGAHQIEK